MKILNLGCNVKTSDSPNVINIDWSVALKIKNNLLFKFLSSYILSEERKKKIRNLPKNILVHDLSKGIPFDNNSVDVVYHSHLLEHIDRNKVLDFLKEVKRVLKPNGIHRIVVPDFHLLCSEYIRNFQIVEELDIIREEHDQYISNIIEQSVRKEANGTTLQRPIVRFIENILIGDARKRGETHQWMYDKINLTYYLNKSGFRDVKVQSYLSSDIENWIDYGLDTDHLKNEYKIGSLYMESRN